MKALRITLLCTSLCLWCIGQAAEWQRLSAKLMTPWGESIQPENVWQEYPRPQLVRGTWMNLNGVWDFYLRKNTTQPVYIRNTSTFREKILVPFGVESALSGIMATDYQQVAKSLMMYRRTFTLTEDFKDKRVLLHFGAVDWQCVAYVNGTKVGEHKGGSDPFCFDITQALKSEGDQELQVAVYDPSDYGGQPRGKQTMNPGSIWYTSCSGIWQTVWLEGVNDAYVERYEVVPDAATGSVRVRVFANDPTCKFSLIARDGEEIVATSEKTRVGQEVTLTIPDAKLWSPDSPFLYNLDIILCADNCQECDRARGYFGIRTFSKAMVDGHPAFLLNGKPIFMFGPLDQGWWPDGLLTPPSYEAMIYDLQTIKSLGMNMVRKHIKVENDLWYEWCDRNGLIVWQDMPSGSTHGSLGTKEEIQHNFYEECAHIVTALKQHPCIGVWVPYNEGWGQDADNGPGHTMRGYLVVRNADDDMGRLMNSASGWTDFGIGDIADAHSYPSPNGSNNSTDRVNVCGEYGGITLMIDGHLWAGSQQTYTQVNNSEDYTTRFNQYTVALQSLQLSKGLWGGVYTQITDVEQEVNGILTYDRKVLKVNDEQLASIRAMIEKTITHRLSTAKSVLNAGDNANNVLWRYRTDDPGEGWEQPEFMDSKWPRGAAGFGKIDQSAARVRTTWDTDEIWIRRNFRLYGVKEEDLPDLCLRMFHDEDTEVYINGVLAMTTTGYNTSYQLFEISAAARQAINLSGDNVLAIHTKQTSGGQYIDAGLSIRSYKSNEGLTISPMTNAGWPTMEEDPSKAYLLTYTSTYDAKMYYACSYDGLHWTDLNGGKSVFGGTDGKPTVQGPFVCRMEDEEGKPLFHLVHGSGDAAGLYHWTSADLLTWQPVNGSDGLILEGDVLSPEMARDSLTNLYIYYWTRLNDEKYVPQYMWTEDFTSFSKVQTYFSAGSSARDLHIFKDNNYYVALFSDPGNRGICMARSTSLYPVRSKFSNVKSIFSSLPELTAPVTIPSLKNDGWLMMSKMGNEFTFFATPMAEAFRLQWKFYDLQASSLPQDMNEGKVVVITRGELSHLLMALDGIDTGIQETATGRRSDRDDNVYTLSGLHAGTRTELRHGTLPHGVYITQGKKITIK